ncbi:MAG: glycosyltransferase family 39 protein [Candidatus Amulumruptor caecigallinarius]|nr:glycosyltransferase family 39 protein [Candidatus Amulumruptor caecigallinarius]MCM1396522.1 glycosyltransferase family 39 protein [Candidatus Amulumruptor caecigallinarius]MCM1453420.1 glycosyltransferase family 39 protein [bacterium]
MDYRDNSTRAVAYALIFAAVALTLLPFLGVTPFHTKGEPREAVVAMSMLNTGNWILPLSNGDVIPYKPPMLAWCIALVSAIFGGEVTEYTSRLPSALALIIMVLAGYGFWRKRAGEGVAVVGSIITFTCFEVYRAGMACRVDMLLTMFMVLAMYSLYRWAIDGGLRGMPRGAVVLMSCAVLTKGPVGVILPCLVTWLLVALCGHRLWRATWKLLLSALLALVVPALWYVAAWERGGAEFLRLAMEENFGRMMGTMSYESHVNPWWYNLLTLLGGIAPYTLVPVLALLMTLVPDVRRAMRGAIFRWCTVAPARFFMFVAPLTVLIFYCFPASKRSVYLLPMYPFMAMQLAMLSLWLARRCANAVKVYTACICLLAMGAFALYVCMHIPSFTGRFTPELSIKTMMTIGGLMAPATWWQWALAGLSALVALVVFGRQFRDSGKASVIGGCVALITLYWAFGGVYQPAVVTAKSDKPIAAQIAAIKPQGTVYAFVGDPLMRLFTIDFYLGDRVVPFSMETSPARGYLLAGEDDGAWFAEHYKGRVDLRQVRTWTKPSNDHRQPLTLWEYTIIE